MQARLQAYLRAVAPLGRDHDQIGPFLATFSPGSDNPFLNYAIPDDNASPTETDVARLVRAYESRGLRARLEYMPEVAPEVEAALAAAGFQVEGRLPLMICDRTSLSPVETPADIDMGVPETDDDLWGMAMVQAEAYDEPELPGRAVVEGKRKGIAGGTLNLIAKDLESGRVVGAGSCSPIRDGLTEVAAIGVSQSHRRRGIATALAGGLARLAIVNGATNPWLMAAHDTGRRAYERAGFRPIGEVLHISQAEKRP